MEKSDLRKKHIALRRTLTESFRKQKSEDIFLRLKSENFYKNAKNIMLYLPTQCEVDTALLICDALSSGKKLFAPVCSENFSMRAVSFSSPDDLVVGKYGILAPKGNENISPDRLDLIIVPGTVFGRNLHRIGYGKGYYDRFLNDAPAAKKVGICFSINLVDSVCFLKTDVAMDMIVTENEVIV